MRVLFVHTGRAFLPELPAYIAELHRHGHVAEATKEPPDGTTTRGYDLVFRFGGFLRPLAGSNTPEVHEYHSASTTRLPRLKNTAKSLLSPRPAGRVFLNEFVQAQFVFLDRIPFIYRDMGANGELLACRQSSRPKRFDIVYGGSISGRPGLLATICTLARKGAVVGVAGSANDGEIEVLSREERVQYVGRLSFEAMPGFLSEGRFGLNYCPDEYPLNRQTSTKVIEYLVAGLPIVSNRYAWMDRHAAKLRYDYLDVDQVSCVEDLDAGCNTVVPLQKAETLTWPSILSHSGFVPFLERVIAELQSI